MILWYDLKKQGATNESMAENPVLRDLSGNGHDATCYNFAWAGMSGIGGYLFNKPVERWYRSSDNNGVYDVVGNTLHITTLNTNKTTYYITNSTALQEQLMVTVDDTGTAVTKPFKIRISGLPEDKQVRINGLLGSFIDGETHNAALPNQFFGNGEHTVQSVTAQNTYTITQINFPSISIDSDTADDVDITIELLPEYPNALVSDGVDDSIGTIPGFPKDEGTAIVIMQELEGNKSAALLMPADGEGFSNIWYNGLFIGGNNLKGIGCYNDMVNRTMINYNEDEAYAKNTSIFTWNNSIPKVTLNLNNRESKEASYEQLHTQYNFFRDNNSGIYAKAALYSVLLFDRTLTTAEIEWVKTNLIEGNDDDVDWYGVEFYTTSPYPDCIRIGNMDLHKTLPVHSQMKGCLLNDDGEVTKYLNESDWTSETRDGSQGQVMVEMPKQSYWKFETDGNIRRVKFSTKPLEGFKPTPQGYVSAYEASLQRSTNKLSSVVNTDADYRGGNNRAEWDGTYRSLLGMPASEICRTSSRDYARNRKADSTEWNCMTYDFQKLLYWLFVVEYATLNSQKTFNEALTADGYHQGGLGPGVTEIDYTKWMIFNSGYPFIPCGHSDSLGNKTGVVDYTMPTEYDVISVKICKVPRYRGIENPFGSLWQCTDGINIRVSPDKPDGDGLSKVYVCSDPSKFNDTNYDGYTYVGDGMRTNGYVKEVIFGEGGEIMPSVVGGSVTTYFCDYHSANRSVTERLCGVRFGGYASHGASAGFVFADSTNEPSYTLTYFGSRLCFIPNNN